MVPSNTITHHIGSHSAIEYLLEVFTTYQQCTPYFRHVSDFAAWGKLEALNLSASTLFKEDVVVRFVQDQCSDALLAAAYCLELLRLGRQAASFFRKTSYCSSDTQTQLLMPSFSSGLTAERLAASCFLPAIFVAGCRRQVRPR